MSLRPCGWVNRSQLLPNALSDLGSEECAVAEVRTYVKSSN